METVAKNLSDLKNLSSILLSSLDETVFFPQLGKFLSKVLPADRILIYLVRDNGSVCLLSKAGKYRKREVILEKGEGPAGHVIRTRKPYFCNNTERDPLFSRAREEGVHAELAMPIAHEGIVIATIHFQCTKSKHEFSREDITKVMEILSEIKTPLANMKMYLAAKNLNSSLLKRVEEKERELQKKSSGINIADNYKIKEKEIVGKSEAMKQILRIADKVAMADVNCLVIGEKGVGKEMIARRIHCRSSRRQKAFISIDCSAFDDKALEAEIFGEESGNFKEENIKNGLLEIANGGTLFLNNVDRLNLALQSKLNTYLSEKMTFRLGGYKPYRADVRIMVASNLDLSILSSNGKFREDLLFSLNTMILRVPSLRERLEDIETLATYFLNMGRSVEEQKSLSPGVIKALNEYNWPGNVRELQSTIERAYILSDGMIVERDHIADHIVEVREEEIVSEEPCTQFSELTLDELEKRHICMALEYLGGNKTKTAKMLGITVKTLYNKLHSYGMIGNKEAL